MAIQAQSSRDPDETLTPGAHRARPGEHLFNFGNLNRVLGGPDYSPAYGACIEGDRMIVAVMNAPAGHMAEAHSHPNEQWIYVLEGVIEMTVEGQHYAAHPGEVIYIPAAAVHSGGARAGQDARFLTVKDASWGLQGIKVK